MGLIHPLPAANTNAPAPTDTQADGATALITNDSLRSYLQIQEQLHITQLAIEKDREEAASNSFVMEERLRSMEKTFANEQLEGLRAMERSDRMILIAAGAFAAIGFLVLLLAAFMQWTAINRLSAAATSLSSFQSAQALGAGEGHLPSSRLIEESNTRFLGLIERLENRIHELEGSVQAPPALPESTSTTPELPGLVMEAAPAEISAPAPDKTNAVTLLLSKSQTLLKLDKPEAALGCLDEVLAIEPAHAEALVKKGAALERLQRFDEAIQCYDRAIAKDNSLTMAYLYKGGVFNRMERYSEALQCYEQALKTRQNGQSANVVVEG